MIKQPLLVISYNRPEKLKQVIKKINFKYINKIYFYSNAPINDFDKIKVHQCRLIINNYNFKGVKKIFFQKTHLPVDKSVVKAINFLFSSEKSGIILEDDIIPTDSFFYLMVNLLKKYENNEKIFHISGFNHLEKINSKYTYHFNQITHVWGWATWKRAWLKYDPNFKNLKKYKKLKLFTDSTLDTYRKYLYEQTKKKLIITWDYAWDWTIRVQNGLCIRLNFNTIKNIGFDYKATNTKFFNYKISRIKTFSIKKIYHPKFIFLSDEHDNKYFKIYEKRNLLIKKFYDPIYREAKKIF